MRIPRGLPVILSVCAAGALAAACATAEPAHAPTVSREPAYGGEWAAVPGLRRMDDLRLPADVRELALTVYPTPRRVDYGDVLLPLDGARYVDESSDDVDARLADAGLELGVKELPPEGYALAVGWGGDRTIVLTVAREDAGRAWSSLAVDQLTTTIDGRRYVRAARLLDAPVFPLRGSKRPQAWERRYRANFAWEVKEGAGFEGREAVATFAPGSPLDATHAGVERILEAWRPWQARGVRRFCVKFDDVGFDMTGDTELRFGTYGAAVRSLLSSVRTALREKDPAATVYFLPQTYWWNDPRLGAYARAIRAAGGLDPDIGLVLTGPEIVSERIDAAGLAGARDLFGSSETPSLLYDNRGREGDWGPLDGREAALASLAEGVFGERGTPVNRLTRLDWLWNPEAYDPERSWRRAVLELAGPEGFAALRDACAAFRRGAPREEAAAFVARFADGPPLDGPLPRRNLATLLRSDLARLSAAAPQTTARAR
jgi:hypothetical protein